MQRATFFLPMLALVAGIVIAGPAYADPVSSGAENAKASVSDVSAQRVVRRPAATKVAMTPSWWNCQSIACRGYLVVGVSY